MLTIDVYKKHWCWPPLTSKCYGYTLRPFAGCDECRPSQTMWQRNASTICQGLLGVGVGVLRASSPDVAPLLRRPGNPKTVSTNRSGWEPRCLALRVCGSSPATSPLVIWALFHSWLFVLNYSNTNCTRLSEVFNGATAAVYIHTLPIYHNLNNTDNYINNNYRSELRYMCLSLWRMIVMILEESRIAKNGSMQFPMRHFIYWTWCILPKAFEPIVCALPKAFEPMSPRLRTSIVAPYFQTPFARNAIRWKNAISLVMSVICNLYSTDRMGNDAIQMTDDVP